MKKLLLSLALSVLWAGQAFGACSIVQSGFNNFGDAGATTTVTLNGVTAGNSIISVSMLYGDASAAPTASVSDGTSYTQAARSGILSAATDANNAVAIHYLHNVSSGTHAVVTTTTSASGFRYGWVYTAEVSGLANAAPNQVVQGVTGETTTPATGNSSATTAANTCIWAAMSSGKATSDAGIDVPATTGYTNRFVRQDVNAEMAGSVDTKSVTSTGVQSAAWGTLTGSYAWGAVLAAFEESGGGSSPVLKILLQH